MYLDFHTHSFVDEPNIIKFYNVDIRKGAMEFSKGTYRHAGVHPWWANEEIFINKMSLRGLFLNKDFTCIGEVGLDRSFRSVAFDIQRKVFISLLEIAVERNDKFIVLHCVKAYQDILNCIKEVGFKGKLVFHNYNGSENITEKLIDRGDYFSFGEMLYQPNSKGLRSLSLIPLEKIFIETDDQEKNSIIDNYHQASVLLDIDPVFLAKRCLENFNRIML